MSDFLLPPADHQDADEPRIIPARCPTPRPLFDRRTGELMLIPCGRRKCSWECRDRWARKVGTVLIRSFAELPPTDEARITVLGDASYREVSTGLGKFLRRLKYRACEYLSLSEWKDRRRHMHIPLRTDRKLTPPDIRELWDKSLPNVRFSHHIGPVRCAAALANYLAKNLRDDAKKELVPDDFPGRSITYSRGFLAKPFAALWREQLADWYSPPTGGGAPKDDSPNLQNPLSAALPPNDSRGTQVGEEQQR